MHFPLPLSLDAKSSSNIDAIQCLTYGEHYKVNQRIPLHSLHPSRSRLAQSCFELYLKEGIKHEIGQPSTQRDLRQLSPSYPENSSFSERRRDSHGNDLSTSVAMIQYLKNRVSKLKVRKLKDFNLKIIFIFLSEYSQAALNSNTFDFTDRQNNAHRDPDSIHPKLRRGRGLEPPPLRVRSSEPSYLRPTQSSLARSHRSSSSKLSDQVCSIFIFSIFIFSIL